MERGAATAMAIAGRSLRLCDACGRERGKWYCEADQATLCDRCDESVHGANSVALRHERVPLGPAGVPQKRAAAGDDEEASHGCMRKKARSARDSIALELIRSVKDEVDSFFVHTPDEEESARQVPVFDPLEEDFSGVEVEDENMMGFAVPCCAGSHEENHDTERDVSDFVMNSSPSHEQLSSGQTPELQASEFCFISMEDLVMDSGSPTESQQGCASDEGEEANNAELEEADELNRIVDEMLGFAFNAGSVKEEEEEENSRAEAAKKITLKLDYEDVLNAWSDRGPFWTEGPRPQIVPDDTVFDPQRTLDHGLGTEFCTDASQAEVPVVHFSDERSDSGGREARVMRYKEKRRTRLFSKTIRYEVRKLNAERRPRLKGRFVKRAIAV